MRRRTIVIVLALALGLCAVPSLARAQGVVGKVTQASGKAQIKRGTSTFDAAPAMPVELHDQLSTGSPGEITLQLLDNSVLTVNESSVLTIDETVVGGAGTTKVGLVSGSVRSLVTAVTRAAGGPSFQVSTPNAVAGVRGTDFTCRHYYGPARPAFPGCFEYTDCETTTGVVGVTNNPPKPGVEVKVGPGEITTVACLLAPLAATTGTFALLGPTAAAGATTAGAGIATFSSPLYIGGALGAAAVAGGTAAGVAAGTTSGSSSSSTPSQ